MSAFYLGGDSSSSSAAARQLAEESTHAPPVISRRRRSSASSTGHPAMYSSSSSTTTTTNRPPPSSFTFSTFPFQAHPGNPDPGMRIPGQPRRGSFDSLAAFSTDAQSLTSHETTAVLPRTLSAGRGEFGEIQRGRLSDVSADYVGQGDREASPLPLPNAPFMNHRDSSGSIPASPASSSLESLPRSPSSASLYKTSAAQAAATSSFGSAPGYAPVPSDGKVQAPIPRTSSTASFRPFMAPPSRPTSSCWTPPLNPSAYPQDPATPNTASGFLTPTHEGFLVPTASKAPLPSTRLPAPLGAEEKPWTSKREPYTLRSYFSTLFFVFLGAAGAAALCYFGYASVPLLDESRLCLVLDESFSGNSLDEAVWNREVQLGGFGNGEFEMTTGDDENLFISNNQLYIHPTLTTDVLPNILDQANYTLPGCTLAQSNRSACSAVGSAALGRVINPVRSARINTKGKKSIKYGKVEVRAKMPRGDWLWPAIWMLPEPVVDNNLGSHAEEGVYGKWPLSGEIDIVEARGNGLEYERQGRNYVRSSLNYGPLGSLYRQIYGWQSTKRRGFDQAFHTFTLEWTERFMRVYVDKRVTAMVEVDRLDEERGGRGRGGFWARGKFPKTALNGSEEVVVHNIWQEKGGAPNAPFDQPFYLIINLAAGGTSGWFPDGRGGKPWYDGSLSAMRDFARDQENWAQTWPESRDERSLRVESVKMWEICR